MTEKQLNCTYCTKIVWENDGKYKPTGMVYKFLFNIKKANLINKIAKINDTKFICYDCYKLLIFNLYDNWYPKFTKD